MAENLESVAKFRFSNALRRRAECDDRQVYLTPSYLLDPLRDIMGGFDLDPCTEPDNPTNARYFYCLPQDGCSLPWAAERVFVNPPYGEARNRWVRRCIGERQGRKIALLIPAATETRIFQEAVSVADSVLFVKSRLRFGVKRANGRQKAASHGSALFAFGFDLSGLSHIGAVMRRVRND